MERKFKKGVAFILALAMVMMGVPQMVFADQTADYNDKAVVTAVSHDNSSYKVQLSSASREITLTVPYGTDSVNVKNIKITWDTSVSDPQMEWGSDAATVEPGNSVTATASYKVGEGSYTSTYTVKVESAAKKLATASGSITKKVTANTSAEFSLSDFTDKYNRNDGNELDKIVIESSGSAKGTFKVGGASYTLGSDINYTDLSSVSYTSASTGSDVYSVKYYESGNPDSVGTVQLTITVEKPTLADIKADVSAAKQAIDFPVSTINDKFKAAAGMSSGNFEKFIFASLPSKGTLYLDYKGSKTAVAKNKEYSYTELIRNVTYVPNSSASGSDSVEYTVYDANGLGYDGKVNVSFASSNIENITARINAGQTYTLPRKTMNNYFKNVSGKNIEYVVFTNASSVNRGTLYCGSSKVTNSAKYYYDSDASRRLADVEFRSSSSADGTATIYYTAYDSNGYGYEGKIVLTVVGTDSSDKDLSDITYKVESGSYLKFKSSDFKSALKKVDYIRFDFSDIASSKGKFYYGYKSSTGSGDSVSDSTKYYESPSGSQNDISDIVFVPKTSYAGTFYLTYTARDTNSKNFTGRVKISVSDDESSNTDMKKISYETSMGTEAAFKLSDFKSALKKVSNYDLDYVKFETPSATTGVMYYNYSSSSSNNTVVTDTAKYYRTGSDNKLIEKVSFVPKKGFNGKVSINYRAYDSENHSYTGTVEVIVGSSDSIGKLSYSVKNTGALLMSSNDINTKFKAVDGDNFEYVKFDIPSGTYGILYYDYVNDKNKGVVVSSGGKYYRSGSDLVSRVSFVPNSTFSGSFDLNYTVYDAKGDNYKGTIAITVTKDQTVPDNTNNKKGSDYFKDVTSDYSWAASDIDYLYKKGVVKGKKGSDSSIHYDPAAKISRGDFMLMLYRAFGLSGTADSNFSDVPKDSYYYQAIGVAKKLGIAQGAYGKFNPDESLSRQDAMVLIYRTIQKTGKKSLAEDSDVSKFGDKKNIADYAKSSVGTLVKAKVINGYNDGTFAPASMMTRAEMAVVLHKVDLL